jgi:hypothetical protein
MIHLAMDEKNDVELRAELLGELLGLIYPDLPPLITYQKGS